MFPQDTFVLIFLLNVLISKNLHPPRKNIQLPIGNGYKGGSSQRKAISRLHIQKFIINNIQKYFILCKVLNRTSESLLQARIVSVFSSFFFSVSS